MKTLIEKTRYVNLLAVISLLLASLGAFAWGAVKTYKALSLIISSGGADNKISTYLIQLVDAFLIALVLYIFAVSIYELVIGKLDLPDWMLAHDLHELKSKLSSVVILVTSVYFAEKVIDGQSGPDILYLAAAISLVSAALIAYSTLGKKD